MAKDSRAIGTGNENRIARILSDWFNGKPKGEKVFFRTSGSGGRRGFRGDLRPPTELFLHIECKKGETWEFGDLLKGTNLGEAGIEGWLVQARRDAKKRRLEDGEKIERKKLVIFTKNRHPDYIVLEFGEWIELRKIIGKRYCARRASFNISDTNDTALIVVVPLEAFLRWAKPAQVAQWSRG